VIEVERQPGDDGRRLGIAEHQQPGDPVGRVEVGVAQQAAGDRPALVCVDGSGRTGLWPGRELQVDDEAAGHRPAEEVAGVVAGAAPAREPAIDVGLAAAGERAATGSEPGEELDSGAQAAPGP
jgi:hypothetical protein